MDHGEPSIFPAIQRGQVHAEHPKVFLTANWRNLTMVNFVVPDSFLLPWLPAQTELDRWNGLALVSVVGFEFQHTRFWGFRVPLHANFSEVNLRFYVRRNVNGVLRRGVVFIREMVARRAVSWVARGVYGEPYRTVPMRNKVICGGKAAPQPHQLEYQWRTGPLLRPRWNRLGVTLAACPRTPSSSSLESFIVEHYWGYSKQSSVRTMEYQVAHPSWEVAPVSSVIWDCDVASTYSKAWVPYLDGEPHSALFAVGSEVAVYRGQCLSEVRG